MNSPPTPSRTVNANFSRIGIYTPVLKKKKEELKPTDDSERKKPVVPEIKAPKSTVDPEEERRKAAEIDAKLARILSDLSDGNDFELTAESFQDKENVENAISELQSLPEVLCDVALKSKNQIKELAKQKKIAAAAKAEFEEAQEQLDREKAELSEIGRNILLAENREQELIFANEKLERQILQNLREKTDIKKKICELQFEKEKQQKLQEELQKEIAGYKRKRLALITRHPLYPRLVEKRKSWAALKKKMQEEFPEEKRASLLDGSLEKEIMEKKDSAKKKLADLDAEISGKRKILEDLKEKQVKARGDLKVARRKFTARLMRLKCQVRGYREERKAEEEQIRQLKQEIQELKEKHGKTYRVENIDFDTVMN